MVARVMIALLALVAVACYNAGRHGYDRTYVPLRDERPHLERAETGVYNDVRHSPDRYDGTLLSWFGTVQRVEPGPGTKSKIYLSFRTHQERHLCAEPERDSCRVTVSQASSGPFIAMVQLRSEDRVGQNRVGVNSLLRLYCVTTAVFDDEGGPILDCEYYRHWPRGQWVHTGMRSEMRR